jgi:hypothetical protein
MPALSRTANDLRRELEQLVADLFESERCGSIPPLDVSRRYGQLVVYARLPACGGDAAPLSVEIRLPSGTL